MIRPSLELCLPKWELTVNLVLCPYGGIKKSRFFEPPREVLRGNVRTPSIARWKARSLLLIRHN